MEFDWMAVAISAPIIGSFLGTVILRVPEGGSVLRPRSACPACGQRLSARDLVPIMSWLALKGRCRHCAAPLGLFYPAVEIAALVVAVWAALVLSGWLLWVGCLFGWALLTLAAIDFRTLLLPDWITLPLIAAGLAVAAVAAPHGWPDHLIGAAAGATILLLLRWVYKRLRGREGLGLGDVKLFAAAGAWVTWAGLPSVLLIAALSGLALAAIQKARGGEVPATAELPFGPHLCLGTWVVWLHGPLIAAG